MKVNLTLHLCPLSDRCLSILQNGKLPQFIPDDVIASMYDVNKKGWYLKEVGIFQVQSFNFCKKKHVLDFIS